MTNCTIGIRHETKNAWERRVPLTPQQVAGLVAEQGLSICVESSQLRIFPDQAYTDVGATVVPGPLDTPVVLGVKEIPIDLLQQGRAYVFFSHTIKGQQYNMPLLRRLMDLGCTLIDYECITDESGRRMVFFGGYAGMAGMLDSLAALGRRLAWEGMHTPLAAVKQTYEYSGLPAIDEALAEVGAALRTQGVPEALRPLVVGITGYGNVSQGAQRIYDVLSPVEVTPEQVLAEQWPGDPANTVYKVVFREEHLVRPRDPEAAFVLQDYYDNPERYEGCFARYLPHLTVLLNGIFWTEAYPRLATLADVKALFGGAEAPHLRVIGDVSCDIGGSVECTVRATTLDAPVFVYEPATGESPAGVAGEGPVVLAVDNLPCELPAEASEAFGTVLAELLPELARADLSLPLAEAGLPGPLRRAVVVHRGELTPAFRHLEAHLQAAKA